MKQCIGTSAVCVIVGLAVTAISDAAGSTFLAAFLEDNLLLALIALLAINTSTSGVILSRLRELAENRPEIKFTRTLAAMRQATLEQVVLVALAVAVLVAKDSTWVAVNWPDAGFVANALLAAVFVYALQIMYDTAVAVYRIVDF